jgi:hypothetical protein
VVTRGQGQRAAKRPPRRSSWNKSLSDSFGPIKQVGVGVAIGFPLFVIGVLFLAILIVSIITSATWLWILAGILFVAGFFAALSGRVL